MRLASICFSGDDFMIHYIISLKLIIVLNLTSISFAKIEDKVFVLKYCKVTLMAK